MTPEHASKDYTSISSDANEQVRNRAAYASFGNEGLTATANSHGCLLQITRYFGEEQKKLDNPSGFVCVEFAELPPPYSIVSRMARLEFYTKSSKNGIRLEIGAENDSPWKMKKDIPKMGFLRDRWPNFITATEAFDVNIEYRVREDTVYQIYTYKKKNSGVSVISVNPKLAFNIRPLFRHLDFSKEPGGNDNKPGETDQDPKPVRVKVFVEERNQEKSVLRVQTKARGNEYNDVQTASCLYISLFINGLAQRLSHEIIDDKTIKCAVIPSNTSELVKNGEIQITLAYTLGQISSEIDDVNSINLVSCIGPWRIPEESEIEFRESSFVNDTRLDFALRRNLEHILSVCSIPVAEPSAVAAASVEILPIALTCGDVSGHRISTAASFYAFQVLLQALRYFDMKAKTTCKKSCDYCATSQIHCESYDCYMRSRIWKVCYGHFKWLYKNLQREDGKKTFYPHYWANGDAIEGWDDHPSLRGRSLADTPFHIIKVAELYKIAQNSEIKTEIANGFKPIIQDWIKELDERNKQGKYAFPHFREEPTYIFYLSDHIMIWRGLRSVEDLGMIEELEPSSTDQGRKQRYTSTEIKTNILKRFTTKNRLSNQYMLAVLRSPLETKFLLQLEDTVLFDAVDLGLFDKTITSSDENELNKKWNNKIDVWKSMIKFQVDQMGNEDIDWMHPLQFALAMMISTKSLGIDSKRRAQMNKMFNYSKSILLGSSSRNGLFPGALDEFQEPTLFSEELKSEDYWYTTFELPYILWTSSSSPTDAPRTQGPQNSIASQTASNAQYQENFMIKQNIPFDNIIDTRNIVEYTDEWMYNEPEFFSHKYPDLKSIIKAILAAFKKDSRLLEFFCHKYPDLKSVVQAILPIFEEDSQLLELFSHNYPVVEFVIKAFLATLEKAGDPCRDWKSSVLQVMRKINGDKAQYFGDEIGGYIIDVPKSRFLHEKKKYTEKKISENCQMFEPLGKTRNPEEAEKRLIHFYRPNRGTALVCYVTSLKRDDMSTFFERHALYDKYFFDKITPILNTWETELHLSFYRITEYPNLFKSISPRDEIEFPRVYQESQNKWISRAVMSFRFDGDVFDRYWTCHFFEYEPQRNGSKLDFESLGVPNLRTANKSFEGDPWKQRQVLELLLFDEILQEILNGTQDILKDVKIEDPIYLLNRSAREQTVSLTSPFSDSLYSFQEISSDLFDSMTQIWRKLRHILQVLEDDLGKNLTMIGNWKDRRTGREPNRPRWTLRDERGYRSAISKLLASNNQKIVELERCYADIEMLKMLLSKRLEITREDLDMRRANDLRLFTYVTVVFLPISFATSLFSMSGTPTAELVGSMATTATVALLVTAVALFNAESLEYLAQPLSSIFRLIFQNPLISICVYFLAYYVFFPLQASLRDNISLLGKLRDFLERLMRIGAINEARKDFFTRLREHNDREQEKKSAISQMGDIILRLLNITKQENKRAINARHLEEARSPTGSYLPPLSQSSVRASSEGAQHSEASAERAETSSSLLRTRDSIPMINISSRLSVENEE